MLAVDKAIRLRIRVVLAILSVCRTRGCASCDCDEEDDDGGDGNDDEMQDEWVCILPIVIHRILTQYQDIQNYKKVNLHHLIYNRSSDPPTLTSLIIHQGGTLKINMIDHHHHDHRDNHHHHHPT